MIKCGYVRVSREDQEPENQIQLLVSEGVPRENIFVDKLSGITDLHDRPGLKNLEMFLMGDLHQKTLYVFEISRSAGPLLILLTGSWNGKAGE